jgi:hypothetical protein
MKRRFEDGLLERVNELLVEYGENVDGGGVWSLRDTVPDIKSRIEWEIARGEIRLDLDAILWAAIQKADVSNRARGQRNIQKARTRQAAGWMMFDGTEADWLNVIVALGKNDRCRYGDVRYPELMRIDALKRRNVESVNASWKEWEHDRDALIPPLQDGLSIESAFDKRLITRIPDLFSQADDEE